MSEGLPHHAENPQQKKIGIFISVLAVIMAIVGAFAKGQANEMIVKEVKASNGFAWYQSKRQRSYMNELEIKRIDFLLAGAGLGDAQKEMLQKNKAGLEKKNAEYKAENEEIERSAKADQVAAATAAHKHHWFEYGEICLHIAVVLCSLVLLTEQKIFLHIGIGATLVGLGLAVMAYVHVGHGPSGEKAEGAASPPAAVAPAAAPKH